LNPQLSRQLWTLLSGSFANALGNGVVFPFLLIYLHNVRHIPLGTAGVVLAALAPDSESVHSERSLRVPALATAAACSFAVALYATGRASADLPVAWAVMPPRLVGTLAVALPLALSSRLRLTRRAAPLVVACGVAEVVGFASFAVGARHGVAVTAVLASQFAAIAGVAAYVLFRERLTRVQLAGVVLVIVGVAVLTWLQA